jgi:hypothetical protein
MRVSEQCAHRARGDDAHTTIARRGGDATGACRGLREAKGMREAVVRQMRADRQRSHMRMGTVLVATG